MAALEGSAQGRLQHKPWEPLREMLDVPGELTQERELEELGCDLGLEGRCGPQGWTMETAPCCVLPAFLDRSPRPIAVSETWVPGENFL